MTRSMLISNKRRNNNEKAMSQKQFIITSQKMRNHD